MEPINRRDFIQRTSMATAALAMPSFSFAGVETKMGIVVHSYGFRWNSKTPSTKYPSFTTAIELIDHTAQLGGAGVQVMVNGWTTDFAKKVRERREKLGLYLEGSIGIPYKQEDIAGFEQTVINAKEAGATILRTVTSTGRRYEVYHSGAEVEDFQKKALDSLRSIEPILKKHKVKLAVENHKDWKAPELAAAMKQLSSEWIGVTLDFGNSIALMEEPMEVIEQLVPYVVTTHAKDMAVEEYKDGFLLSEVPLGQGFLDLDRIFALCVKHNPQVRFNLEMITRDPLQIPCLTNEYWSVFPDSRPEVLAKGLRLIKEKKNKELPRVSQLDGEGKLAVEEQNIVECMNYSKTKLGK
ncbi:MAG TPA: TIM barrel protein [Cyclobacteriaceae bacterium]|nr:TIM barrel protein [Cyclobacteriaceae bacterium]